MIPAFIINFNPLDKEELLAVDRWAVSTGEELFPVAVPFARPSDLACVLAAMQGREEPPPRALAEMPDYGLARWLDATRACPTWGIGWDMIQVAYATLELLEEEAKRRVVRAEKRERALRQGYQDWRDFDLLAAVEAMCGEGRKVGKAWWFRCCWHDDHAPSLEVSAEKKLWHCWGCDAKGGAVEWRKRME